MNHIKFETLGIEIEDHYSSLRDDGFVEDVEEHTKQVFLEFGKTLDDYVNNKNTDYLIIVMI